MKNLYRGIAIMIATITLVSKNDVALSATEYTLVIDRQSVTTAGNSTDKLTINGTIPGPVLHFTEGDELIVHVINQINEETSVHWHGLLLPDNMDGVPGIGGYPGIPSGETFTYRFNIRQSGTYWYHAHSRGQEQDGLYGAIVIEPQGQRPQPSDRDYVIVLSDFHSDNSDRIMANLKKSSEYYQYDRRTLGDFFSNVRQQGFKDAWSNAAMWGKMRMLPTDLSDVSGYTFLVNGRTPDQNWTGLFSPGERIRLRFVNASAMTFYDVRIPGLPMTVIAADGQDVEPVTVDEFRFGVAETYDVIVTPEANRAYTIAAESIDRTGFAQGTLAPREGMVGPQPESRPRALLTMADMAMTHTEHDRQTMETNQIDHANHGMAGRDDTPATVHNMPGSDADYDTGVPGSGWAQTFSSEGTRILSYRDLRALNTQMDTRAPEREIEIRLGGNMERYIWTLNGRKFSEARQPINLRYGERVRLKFVNDTMMAHPMHLHGMFVQLENGQPAEKLPNKHVVIIAPGDSYSVLLTADEPGEWAFHCHMIFHMMAGMMDKVVVARLDSDTPLEKQSSGDVRTDSMDMGGQHAH